MGLSGVGTLSYQKKLPKKCARSNAAIPFPRVCAHPFAPPASLARLVMHAISPLILVVDDEPALLRLLEVWLRQEGFAVVTAASGAEALEAYRRHAAALAVVLLDVRMPGMD